LSFRGYRVRERRGEKTGLRATPIVRLANRSVAVLATVCEFWQQFPKAIEIDGGKMRIRLFPKQFPDLFELQGGEQKTHTIWLSFDDARASAAALDWVHQPALVRAPLEWVADSGAVPWILGERPEADRFDAYMDAALNDNKGLLARREWIDEYGWRNFGEIYADHEGAYYDGPKPVISHYNNQFDSIQGALLQFIRTGDPRWREVSDPLARHVIDIDIYHTQDDRAAYRGGLFWMTDHYKDAQTSTHRTFSRLNNKRGQPNGGGPGCEHNFTSGLLYYHYFTGDPLAREAVISLADWVLRMDDGRLNRLRWLDSGPTGLASSTTYSDYHGPGRGPGLSINALLDGWLLTGSREYLHKAEELIRRCIHPKDDIDSRDLLNIELRWSYPIFLSSLLRYLHIKSKANDCDFMFSYARAALLHYAAWMANNEKPYFDQRERMQFPTETWAAQEFRKANVIRAAAPHADEPMRSRLLIKGAQLSDRAWKDLLSFDSRYVSRAIAILMIEGSIDQHLRCKQTDSPPVPAATHDFGEPQPFLPQKQRVRRLLRSPLQFLKAIWGQLFQPLNRQSL
jgi:hypothetical protein